jgi:predicted RNase H-like HicB family nuclease
MSWDAVLERWSSETLLFIPALPGFQVNAESPEDALADAEERVDAYIQWLRDGELLPENFPSPEGIAIAETRVANGEAGPIFDLDTEPIDEDYAEFALAIGRAALSDLLFVFDDVPDEGRSEAERILRHVAELDRWYATRMAPAQGKPFTAIEDELVQSASLFEETVDGVMSSRQPTTWTLNGEDWSIRKALRRRTGHLREHLADLLSLTR